MYMVTIVFGIILLQNNLKGKDKLLLKLPIVQELSKDKMLLNRVLCSLRKQVSVQILIEVIILLVQGGKRCDLKI